MHSSAFCRHVSPLRYRTSRKSRADKPSGPFRRQRYEQEATCTSDRHLCAGHTFGIVGWTIHLLFLTVCGTNQREYLLGATTQPIKIQEEGIPLWPNKGVLIALPQEPSFGRFFAGFDHAWLPSPRRPSSSQRFFEAVPSNRRAHNPPLPTVLRGHRRTRLRQLRQPNRWTKRFPWHESLTAPRS